MLSSRSNSAYNPNNTLQLLTKPGEYFQRLEQMIAEAKHIIHLQTYIFQDDITGTQVSEWLMQAAQRGVKVYVLVDGYASQSLPHDFVERIRNAGVYFSFFEPIIRSKKFYVGRRMHHKIVAVDYTFALIGGINIADRYNKIPNMPSWMNIDLYIKGHSATELSNICAEVWNKNTRRVRISKNKHVDCNFLPEEKKSPIRVRRNDWVMRRYDVSRSYKELFNTAEKEIIIICSYFIPGRTFRNLMKKASARGVDIQVVVAGPSDVMTAKYAERYLYDWLIRNKIRIYEYQDNVLHAKASQRDGKWMTIGSYNLNEISAHASLELNIDIDDPEFVQHSRKTMLDIIKNNCIEITPNKKWNIFARFGHWAWYQIFRLMLFLFTFYLKPGKE